MLHPAAKTQLKQECLQPDKGLEEEDTLLAENPNLPVELTLVLIR